MTAKALRPVRSQRNSHQPAVPFPTAKGPQPALSRAIDEPKALSASTEAPQPARLRAITSRSHASRPPRRRELPYPRAIYTSRKRAPRQLRRRESPVSRAIDINRRSCDTLRS